MSDRNSPDDGMWFAPKLIGFGAGLPIAWQGWVLLGGYVLAAIAIARSVHGGGSGEKAAAFAGLALLTVLFMVVARFKTRGGWKWRWGCDG